VETNTVVGLVMLAVALVAVVVLSFWGRHITEKIARENLGRLRDYMSKKSDD
jgi:hypothetical protein